MNVKKLCIVLLSALLILSLTACAGTPAASQESSQSSQASSVVSESPASSAAASEGLSDTDEYPIVIEHAFGETVLEAKPERVVTIAWANQDTPLALGVVPVGFSMANFGPVDSYGMHSWTSAKVAQLGETDPNVFQDTDGIDYEAISDAQPDVILAGYSGLTQEEYDLLSQIAPVVAYPREPWQTYLARADCTERHRHGYESGG